MTTPLDSREWTIVCLSPQDWDVPLKTNRQRIMLEAVRAGHTVLFVETRGWLISYLLSRQEGSLVRRLRRVLGTETLPSSVMVHRAAVLLPRSSRYRVFARANAAVQAWGIRRLLRALGGSRPCIAWIYDPRAVEVATRLPRSVIAYDCVDDYAETIGNPRSKALIAAYDRQAGRTADIVFATTESLAKRHRSLNEETHLVPNVADYEHFAKTLPRPAALTATASPIIGFVGNIIELKVDLDLLVSVASARPNWEFVLIGPVAPTFRKAVDRLLNLPNATWLGPMAYDEIPAYLHGFSVGLIPYLANSYTENCFPLKLYEYLAAGLPVVASGLTTLPDLPDDVAQVTGSHEVIGAIEQALVRTDATDVERRRSIAAQNTWTDRAGRMFDAVASVVNRQVRMQ